MPKTKYKRLNWWIRRLERGMEGAATAAPAFFWNELGDWSAGFKEGWKNAKARQKWHKKHGTGGLYGSARNIVGSAAGVSPYLGKIGSAPGDVIGSAPDKVIKKPAGKPQVIIPSTNIYVIRKKRHLLGGFVRG